MDVFDTRSSKASSLNTSGSIRRRSWNAFIKVWSSHFLFRAEEPGFLIFFEEKGGLSLYIKSNPSRITVFDTWRNDRLACLSFYASFLTSLSFLLFLASCLLSSTLSRLTTQVLWLLYWIPVHFARCFFCVLVAKSSVLVQFRITLSAIANLAALRVLYKRVSLSKSNVWCRNNDISSSICINFSILPGVGGIAAERNHVCRGVFELALVLTIS